MKKVEKRDAEIEIEILCKKMPQINKNNRHGWTPGSIWGGGVGRGERFISEFLNVTSVV